MEYAITSKSARAVAEVFERWEEYEEEHKTTCVVNMGMAFLKKEKGLTCGCHATWYDALKENKKVANFSNGIRLISVDLLNCEYDGYLPLIPINAVQMWAKRNPKIWGNPFGYGMFTYKGSFDDNYNEKFTVAHFAAKWHGVADLLEELGL